MDVFVRHTSNALIHKFLVWHHGKIWRNQPRYQVEDCKPRLTFPDASSVQAIIRKYEHHGNVQPYSTQEGDRFCVLQMILDWNEHINPEEKQNILWWWRSMWYYPQWNFQRRLIQEEVINFKELQKIKIKNLQFTVHECTQGQNWAVWSEWALLYLKEKGESLQAWKHPNCEV